MANFLFEIILLFFFFMLLIWSANLAVANLKRLAATWQIPSFLLGFFLLGLTTTLPELFVAINSVIEKIPQLSIGNLLGASIALLTFTSGLAAVVSGRLSLGGFLDQKALLLTIAVIILPSFLLFDGRLSFLDGLFLLLGFFCYAIFLGGKQSLLENFKAKSHPRKASLKALVLSLTAIFLLFIAGRGVVETTAILTQKLNISYFVSGLLFLSLGTTLPEIILVITALRKKALSLAMGDILGSAAANTLILGFVGLASPFTFFSRENLLVSLLFLPLAALLFAFFVSSQKKINRREGLILLLVYLFFVLLQLRF